MNFANLKSLAIPEGNVTKISHGNVVLWQKITSRIPAEYQEVEYISKARTAKAYIDLGFSFDKGATIYLHYNKTETSYYMFGAGENSGVLRCMLAEGANISFYGSTGSKYISGTIPTNLGEHHLKYTLKKGGLLCEDLITSKLSQTFVTQEEYTMTSNLYLMGQNYNGELRYDNSVQIYSFSYYDNDDVLICELVPCYRKADGVIGMYDVARKTFLTNAGSGSFTKGADV